MTDKKHGPAEIDSLRKVDPETGEEIETTQEERTKLLHALQQLLRGQGTVVFSDEALEQLKAKGMTPEQVEAMLAEAVEGKH